MIGTRTRSTTAVGLLLILVIVTLLLIAPIPGYAQWIVRLLDLGHLPLFAALTLVFVRLLRGRVVTTVILLLVFAGAIELIQDRFGRSGNWEDFVRSMLGIAIGLVLRATWRRRSSGLHLAGYGLLLMVLVSGPVYLAAPQLLEAADSYRRFPTIVDFRREWQMTDFTPYNADFHRIGWPGRPGQYIGYLQCEPGHQYCGILLTPVMSDWRGYRRLCFQVIGEDPAVAINLSIKDRRPFYDYDHRFNFSRAYGPQPEVTMIDLAEVAAGPKNEPLDLSQIQFLNFYCTSQSGAPSFFLCKVWLD